MWSHRVDLTAGSEQDRDSIAGSGGRSYLEDEASVVGEDREREEGTAALLRLHQTGKLGQRQDIVELDPAGPIGCRRAHESVFEGLVPRRDPIGHGIGFQGAGNREVPREVDGYLGNAAGGRGAGASAPTRPGDGFSSEQGGGGLQVGSVLGRVPQADSGLIGLCR
jgi:hypothetical protein